MKTLTATTTLHIQVYVAGTLRIRLANLCNVLRGDYQLPSTGEIVVAPEFERGHASCRTCERRLRELGYSLSSMARALRPAEEVAAEEREYERRRYGWNRDSFVKEVLAVADRYQRMAEETRTLIQRDFPTLNGSKEIAEREALLFADPARAFSVANRIHHDLMWAVANLGLDVLTYHAVELDAIARQAQGDK